MSAHYHPDENGSPCFEPRCSWCGEHLPCPSNGLPCPPSPGFWPSGQRDYDRYSGIEFPS